MNKKNILFPISLLFLAMLACVSSSTPVATESAVQPPTLILVVPSSTFVSTTSTPAIRHVDVPGEIPVVHSGLAGDQDSSITADEQRAPSGDRFTFGRYERPFNTESMDVYFPELDILGYVVFRDNSWIYVTITVKSGNVEEKLTGKYGVEFDSDIDGRGDWLITIFQPVSSDWTTDGVEVWFDSDNDVGGSLSLTADEQTTNGNGYDVKIFDRGQGDDADLAWARLSAEQPNTLEVAVKSSLLGTAQNFMAGVWAGNDQLDPALFDLNDHFTQEQAGSSLIEFEFYYPIKAISEIDNACRVAVGFQPSGSEPGLCPVIKEEIPNEPCPPENVVCFNFGNQTVCYCLEP